MKLSHFAILAGLIWSAFLLPVAAQAGTTCDPVDAESRITDELQKSPDYLIAVIEKDKLVNFWKRLTEAGLLNGNAPPVDKIYLLKSENHPNLLYIVFLKEKCIVDYKMTLKDLVIGFIQ